MTSERSAFEVALLAHALVQPGLAQRFSRPRLSPEASELYDFIGEWWACAQCAGLETAFMAATDPADVATRCSPEKAIALAARVDWVPIAEVVRLGSIRVVMHELGAEPIERVRPPAPPIAEAFPALDRWRRAVLASKRHRKPLEIAAAWEVAALECERAGAPAEADTARAAAEKAVARSA
jgi:hypothetical protein